MAYRFKLGRSIERDARRVAEKQLAAAIAERHAIGNPKSDETIHETRRHVKTVTAAPTLVFAWSHAFAWTRNMLRR
jgi:hypothetical protein